MARRRDAGPRSPGQKFVLCIDDHSEVLAILREFLQTSGYSVLTAANGKAGLKLLASNPVDAVIVDYEMPGKSGAEVAREVRRLRPHVPILMFSGYVAELPATAFENVDAVVAKGERAAALLEAIAGLFRIRRPARKPMVGSRGYPHAASRSKSASRM